MSKLKDAVNSDIAAIILEPIQGEGGVHIAEDKYLREVKEVCEENNILLIVDEVQTGFGRTGTMFAIEPSGVIPDILCLAKSIAAGVPMGAVLVSDKINVPRGKHGSTFGGNPLSSAAALANIAFIKENNLVENAKVNGTYFLNLLKEEILDIPLVRNIRGVGLMIGIEFKKDIKTLIDELLIQGLLVIPTGKTVIRLLPPIIINQAQIDQIVQILKEILLNH
jgi:acetylornithine/LysW-gamma-L-lysine aminotransferase